MSREDDVYTALHGTLETLYLTGGLYKYGALGPDGVSRSETPSAFDSGGFLKPCGLIRQRSAVNTGDLSDFDYKLISMREMVEIYLYQDRTYSTIDSAKDWIIIKLTGATFSDSFEVELANVVDRQRDNGALQGASLIRLDFSVVTVSMDWPIGI